MNLRMLNAVAGIIAAYTSGRKRRTDVMPANPDK